VSLLEGKQQDQPLTFCGRFGVACIFRTALSTCSLSIFSSVRPSGNGNQHQKHRGTSSENPRQCTLQLSTLQQVVKFRVPWSDMQRAMKGGTKGLIRGLVQLTQFRVFEIGLCSVPHLWSWILVNDQKNMLPAARGRDGIFARSSRRDDTSRQSSQLWNSLNEPRLLLIEKVLLAAPSGKRPRCWPDTGGVIASPTWSGAVYAWIQQNYPRLLLVRGISGPRRAATPTTLPSGITGMRMNEHIWSFLCTAQTQTHA